MLSFRLAIVTAAAGLCLWGLFSLLDSLQEPGLLRSARATVVKGCDSPESQRTAPCPALFCQKALLDAQLLPLKTRFEVSIDRRDTDQQRVVGGSAYRDATGDTAAYFVCVVAGSKVIDRRLIDNQELDELAAPLGNPSS